MPLVKQSHLEPAISQEEIAKWWSQSTEDNIKEIYLHEAASDLLAALQALVNCPGVGHRYPQATAVALAAIKKSKYPNAK